MRFLFPLLIAAAPAWAQDHSACYSNGAVPSGVRDATRLEKQEAYRLAFGTHMIPLAFRRFCGFEGEQNTKFVDVILEQAGCSKTSTVGAQHLGYLEMDVSELSHKLVGCELRGAASQNDLATFCLQVAKLEIAELVDPYLSDDSDAALSMQDAYGAFDILIEKVTEKGC